jgi:hypothetical protein
MKSKEEIVNKWLEEDVYGEPLSELDLNECGEIEFRGLKSGFISGYTQCQEDMADMKYTEHDLHNLLRARRQLKSYTNKDVVTVFIDSLNKQD